MLCVRCDGNLLTTFKFTVKKNWLTFCGCSVVVVVFVHIFPVTALREKQKQRQEIVHTGSLDNDICLLNILHIQGLGLNKCTVGLF